jgi:hypothetical protein
MIIFASVARPFRQPLRPEATKGSCDRHKPSWIRHRTAEENDGANLPKSAQLSSSRMRGIPV